VKLPRARRLYEEGIDAVSKGRWSIALDRFKASYELAPRAQTVFNLAGAQSQTGRLVEAAETYRKFLRETGDGRFSELRIVAVEQLELLDRQIAQVTLDIIHLEPGDVVAVDEVELPHAALREAIPMNPGPHVARVQRGARVIGTRSLTLAAGAAEAVRLELPVKALDLEVRPRVEPPAVTAMTAMTATTAMMPQPVPAPRAASRGWLRSPLLWSGVAVVVAGGAVGTYLLTRPDGVIVR
jgi:hypothetical protein